MRQIFINSHEVEISPNEAVEVTLRSPLCTPWELVGSFTSTFRVPYATSARNQLIFQFLGNPRVASTEVLRLPFALHWGGNLKHTGWVEASKIGEEVELSASIDLGGWNEAFYQRKPNSLADQLGTTSPASIAAWESGPIVQPRHYAHLPQMVGLSGWQSSWNLVNFYQNGSWLNYAVGAGDERRRAVAPCWRVASYIHTMFALAKLPVLISALPTDYVIVGLFDCVRPSRPGRPAFLPPSEFNYLFLPDVATGDLVHNLLSYMGCTAIVRGGVTFIVRLADALLSTPVPIKISPSEEIATAPERVAWRWEVDAQDPAYTDAGGSYGGYQYGPWVRASEDSRPRRHIARVVEDTGNALLFNDDDAIYRDASLRWFRPDLEQDYTYEMPAILLSHAALQGQWATGEAVGNRYTNISPTPEGATHTWACAATPLGWLARDPFQSTGIYDWWGISGMPWAGNKRYYAASSFSSIRVARLQLTNDDPGTFAPLWELSTSNQPSTGGTPPAEPWSMWPEQPGSDFERWQAPVLDWLNNRAREFEAEVAEDSPEYFVNTLEFERPRVDADGTVFFIKEVRFSYLGDRITAPKIKALTL